MNKKIIPLVVMALLALVAASLFIVYNIVVVRTNAPAGARTAAVPAVDDRAKLFAKANQMVADGDLIKAREILSRIIEKFPDWNEVSRVQEALDNVNIAILFSPIETPDSFIYEVQKGDALAKIASRNNTTVELIMRANNLKTPAIRIGQKLKLSKSKFSVLVDKSQNILTLKADGEILKTYRVSTGKNNSTPVGAFTVVNKLTDPAWYPPEGGMVPSGDPKNVLGSRWIGISKEGYGIHGTTDPDSIGKSVTEGCVRMTNADVEELYVIIPRGAEVVIED